MTQSIGTRPGTRARPLILDSSLLSTAACSTRVLMRHLHGMASPTENTPVACGSAIHTALEAWFKGKTTSEAMDILAEAYRSLGSRLDPDDPRSWDNVSRTLAHWLENHQRDGFPWVVPSPNMVEIGFTYPLAKYHGRPILIAGRLDLVGYELTDLGKRWVIVDHKTSSQSGEWFTSDFDMSAQVSCYTWVARKILGHKFRKMWINHIHLTKLSTAKTKCPEHGMERVKCALLHPKHSLFSIERSNEELAAWHQSAVVLAKRVARLFARYPRLEDVRKAPAEGVHYYRMCKNCDFRNWCRSGRQLRLVKTQLRHDPWDPRADD